MVAASRDQIRFPSSDPPAKLIDVLKPKEETMSNLRSLKLPATVLSVILAIIIGAVDANAQLDPTFGTNGVADAATGVGGDPLLTAVLPDGKIFLVSVKFWGSGTGNDRLFFARLNSDGTPDTTYAINGVIEVPIPGSIPSVGRINGAVRQPDGKIIIVGTSDNLKGLIARYNEDASLDTSFASGGIHRPNIGESSSRTGLCSVLILPDNRILVAGFARSPGGIDRGLSLLRYLPNGTLDPTFGTNGGYIIHGTIAVPFFDRAAELFALESDGKIVVGNKYESDGGSSPIRSSIRRFNADGTVDNTFTVINFPGSGGPLKSSRVQPDNKILAGTQILTTDTLERVHNNALISRFNSDGTPDLGFGTAGQSSVDVTHYQNDTPIGLQVLSDGQIIVAVAVGIDSNRTIYRGSWLSLVRLSSAGSVNGKFLGASGAGSDRAHTTVLADGKILTATGGGTGVRFIRATGVSLQIYKMQGMPFAFLSGAPGVDAKPSVYRPADGSWPVYPSSGLSAGFGLPDDIPVPSDYIGRTFTPEFAFFRPSNGTWYISRQFSDTVTDFFTVRWGLAGDIPVPADYDGDGKSDVAVFRPSNGVWYIRNSSDESIRFVQWGLNGDKPAVGDFDGDGYHDIGVFRPSDGNWYIIRSSDGGFTILHFGLDGDIPVQEDYDGDGKFDIAVYRPSTGVWYRLNSSDGSFFAYQWGLAGDIPVPADYDSDRKINIAVWRPSNGYWYIVNPDLTSMHFYIHGNPTDIPLPGKF